MRPYGYTVWVMSGGRTRSEPVSCPTLAAISHASLMDLSGLTGLYCAERLSGRVLSSPGARSDRVTHNSSSDRLTQAEVVRRMPERRPLRVSTCPRTGAVLIDQEGRQW